MGINEFIDPLLIEDVTTAKDDPNEIFCVPPGYMFKCILKSEGYSEEEIWDIIQKYSLVTSENLRWSKKDRVYKLRARYPQFIDYKKALICEGFDPEDYVFFRQSYKFMDNDENHELWVRLKEIFDDLYTYKKNHGCYNKKSRKEFSELKEPSFQEYVNAQEENCREIMGETYEKRVQMLKDNISDDERKNARMKERRIWEEAE